MHGIRYLLDEDVRRVLATQLRHHHPSLDVLAVGESGAPPRQTPDPELLLWAEQHDRVLVSRDRNSLPAHVEARLKAGRHIPGVFLLRVPVTWAELIDWLSVIAEATHPAAWQDGIWYVPL